MERAVEARRWSAPMGRVDGARQWSVPMEHADGVAAGRRSWTLAGQALVEMGRVTRGAMRGWGAHAEQRALSSHASQAICIGEKKVSLLACHRHGEKQPPLTCG